MLTRTPLAASGDTLDPVLHFLLFVPSPENRPLRIHDSGAFALVLFLSRARGRDRLALFTLADGAETTPAFITPQRGGVVILNPPAEAPRSARLGLSPADFAPSFRLFASQLRTLLGVASPSPSTASPSSAPRTSAPTPAERDALIRRRLREAAHDSVDSLEALVTLARRIPNMRIAREVQGRVRAALDALDAVRGLSLGLGRQKERVLARAPADVRPPAGRAQAALSAPASPATALSHAARAQRLASEAYFDPSMLALLYFPDEHKYAVYTPLFGPVAVPLLVALLREVKEWREGRRRRKGREEKEEEVEAAEGKEGGREGEVG